VQKICYRCAIQVEEGAAFCPSCGAPQIRVPAPAGDNPALEMEAGPPSEPAGAVYAPAVLDEGIQWGVFSRIALPLAALTGFIAAMFFPAVIVAFPLSFRRTLLQYRHFHPGALPARQGARLGAFMAMLTFAASLIFYVPTIVLGHDALIGRIRDLAARYPDPQAQQVLWLTTPSGFIVLSVFMLIFVLFVMLLLGLLCGALMTGQSEKRS
jgi:hypothetical protein